MSIHDRDYAQSDQSNPPATSKAQQSAKVDKMLDQLDLSNLPASVKRSPLQRVLAWFRGVLRLRGGSS